MMTARPPDRAVRLAIRDDGSGGADPDHGSGLVGLRDRVEARSEGGWGRERRRNLVGVDILEGRALEDVDPQLRHRHDLVASPRAWVSEAVAASPADSRITAPTSVITAHSMAVRKPPSK